MRRKLFNFATALSLVFCVATVVLWVRSYSGSDSVSRRWMTFADEHHFKHHGQQIQWTLGQVRFLVRDDASFFPGKMTPDAATPHWSYFRYGAGHVGWKAPPARSTWNRLGFATWESGRMSSFAQSYSHVWAVPAWLPTTTFAVLPAAWATRFYRRRRRKQTGRCITCGYDLRATPDRCPECGTDTSARVSASTQV